MDGLATKAEITNMAASSDFQIARRRPASVLRGAEGYAGALAMVGISTLVGLWIAPRWGTAAIDMAYLPAVLVAAALWGLGPGLLAGVGAALAYNFFFTAPVHTFRINRAADVVTVVVLLIVALVTSRLAAGIRAQARIAAAHAARNATIAGFAGRLLSCSAEEQIAATACKELHSVFGCNAMLASGLPQPDIVAAAPSGNRLTPSDLAAAALTLESGDSAGRSTPRMQPAEWQFHAVRSPHAIIGAVGLARDDGASPLEDQAPLLTSLLDQVALALERARLERQGRELLALRERDRLRSTLFASIGHDLRPSLDSIAEAVRELKRNGPADRKLALSIGTEVLKLQRYLTNVVELGPPSDLAPISAGPVIIDLFQRRVSKDGKTVHLTPKEYALLAELAKHPGRVLSHEHLIRAVWGPAQQHQIEYLRVAIRALRQKLERNAAQPEIIINEPAVGYRLNVGGFD